ncbi:bifunctional 2-polyprenyl-6-hydroxyphenol methylase/3-demethylubiquinol 3-O-methyltransferase UbiG [Leptolyngbya sp. FACHB-261]|uniref:class I SAM-dependent methyltransferase n=1 Tax=Leptolyngbya sp. FACHB-261 TaxID=2692806 RepID=UPI001684B1E4|nr:class I SAM-dependent methyltransferase [Leptolyngbya sp. FACHB-261]MBD2103012.1 class I SAM-dependent methyltransferase [Leptolyngbya sp. FACHB-261]
MSDLPPELLEKIRQQFEFSPYPKTPLEQSPKDNVNLLFIHNLVTSFYLKDQRVVQTQGKFILDAGCGSGYKSLVLAVANPGATIIGIDLSEESVDLARKRLEYHGFDDLRFHALAIEDLPQLNVTFDYINCDEVLYLTPDPTTALKAMASVLRPGGILRTNLHSYYQRIPYFRAQQIFKMMGLMDESPKDLEAEIVGDIMRALKGQVRTKLETWEAQHEGEQGKASILMNYLLQGDKGYTVPEMFSALKAADLEFLSMVNWRSWEILELFQNPNELPMLLEMGLPDLTVEERLQLFDLLHPVHRLLDFWCAHPGQAQQPRLIQDWQASDWQNVQVHLHPQLKTESLRQELRDAIITQRPFEISKYLTAAVGGAILLDTISASCILLLWDAPVAFPRLVDHWLKLKPLDLLTLQPTTETEAQIQLQQLLTRLETFLYVLLEIQS